MPRLVQHAVAEPKQVAGDARLGVGEERQHPRLGVPEVVAVVGVAGQTLGRDSRCLRPATSPGRGGTGSSAPPAACAPGAVRCPRASRRPGPRSDRGIAPLRRDERLEPGADHAVERAPAPLDELGGVDAAGGLVRGVLDQADGDAGLGVDGDHELRRVGVGVRRDVVSRSARRARGRRRSRASSRSRPSGSRAAVARRPAPPSVARGSGDRVAWRCRGSFPAPSAPSRRARRSPG